MATLTSRYLSGLESGKGFIGAGKSALKGAAGELKPKNIKETLVKSFFGGDDIISAAIRGSFGVGKKTKKGVAKAPTPEASQETGLSEQATIFLKIIAKNSMSLPGMARDMNVLRQNLQKLVKLKGGEASTGADAFFLKQAEREAALEAQAEKERTPKETKEKDGPVKKTFSLTEKFNAIIKTFKTSLLAAFKIIFSAKNILKVLTKAGPIALIGVAIFSVFKGWKKVFETGSFKEGMIEALGTMLNILTFGLVDQDSIRKVFDSLENFFRPVTDTISNIFSGIKGFFKNIFGRFIKVDETPKPPEASSPPAQTEATSPQADSTRVGAEKTFMETIVETRESSERARRNAGRNKSPKKGDSKKELSDFIRRQQGTVSRFNYGNGATPEGIADEIEFIESGKRYFEQKRDETLENGMIEESGEYQKAVNLYVNRLDELVELKQQKTSSKPTPVVSETPAPPSAEGASEVAPAISAGEVGGAASSGGVTPSVDTGSTAPSGAEVAETSAQIAEAQRMEFGSDETTIIEDPTFNNSSGTVGKEPTVIADAYDSELAEYLTS